MPTLLTETGTPPRTPLPRGVSPDADRYLETWDGVDVVPPIPNDEHQDLVGQMYLGLYFVIQQPGLGVVRPGVNVTDRDRDWRQNFRGPDVVVYLNTNRAQNRSSHWVGGPDFLAEIVSPGEDPYAKLDFYAKVDTGEVLIVHRDPWKLELFALTDGKFALTGAASVGGPDVLTSRLGFTLRLMPGAERPQIELAQPSTGKTWLI